MHWICPSLQQEFCPSENKVTWSICGVNCEIPFKKTSVKVAQERQSDILRQIQGEEGSKEEQELTAEGQNYPEKRVGVLLGYVVPFSGADPAHSTSSLLP